MTSAPSKANAQIAALACALTQAAKGAPHDLDVEVTG